MRYRGVNYSWPAALIIFAFAFVVIFGLLALSYWLTLHMMHSWFDVHGELARASAVILVVCGGTPLLALMQNEKR